MATVIITGGGGFLGQCLATSLLRSPEVFVTLSTPNGKEEIASDVVKIVLADVAFSETDQLQPLVRDGIKSGSVELRSGSVASEEFCFSLLSDQSSCNVSVFHLGAVMSGTGESNFDLCMDVNLRGSLNMLEAARAHQSRVKFIYASAGATIGSGAPTDWIQKEDVITDATRATPHTTYGMTKAVSELLMADYSRREFIDGRGARLPTVVVRAGEPNAATTGCFSGIVREPLAGVNAIMPIASDVKHAVTGVGNVVQALRVLHDSSVEQIDGVLGFDRTVFLPAAALSLSMLERAVLSVVDPSHHDKLGKVTYDVDEFLSRVVGGFPTKIDAARARKIGIAAAPTAENVVRDYIRSFPDALVKDLMIVPRKKEAGQTEEKNVAAASHRNIVAVITGAGSGIGRAVAVRLARGGWGKRTEMTAPKICLVLCGRRSQPLEETAALAEKIGATCLINPCDVTDERGVESLFGRARTAFGRVDLLFNNAGINRSAIEAVDFPVEDFRRIVDANLTGAFLVAREAMRTMKEQRPQGGRIINNGSISADRPRPGGIAYTCSKHAVTGLTKTLALEGREHNIPVGQIDFGNVSSAVSSLTQSGGALQPDGTNRVEPEWDASDAAATVASIAALPLGANVLQTTVLATKMPYVGRG